MLSHLSTEELSRARQIGHHEHEKTWLYDAHGKLYVVKALQAPPMLRSIEKSQRLHLVLQAQLPPCEGVASWIHFQHLSAAESAKLNLDEHHHWLLAARHYVEGQTLDNAQELGKKWTQWALELCFHLRDLHDQGFTHGDIQPHNIIVDEAKSASFIDLPLISSALTESVHVHGSAPLMAPELWESAGPTVYSDVYALATLICWMANTRTYPLQALSIAQWAIAHRTMTPRIPPNIPERLRGVLSRMLTQSPSQRAPLQELIDTLEGEYALRVSIPRLTIPGVLRRETSQQVLQTSLTREPFCLTCIVGQPFSGKSILLKHLESMCQLLGHTTYFVTASKSKSTQMPHKDPWQPIKEMCCFLSTKNGEHGVDLLEHIYFGQGDQLNLFDQLLATIMDEISHDHPTTIFWDDLHLASPDIQAWWRYVSERLNESTEMKSPFRLIASVDETCFLSTIGPSCVLSEIMDTQSWHQWRAHTLRVEVRDIARGKWQTIVDEFCSRPAALIDALNIELGLSVSVTTMAPENPPEFFDESDIDEASGDAPGQWQTIVSQFVTQGAFSQACSYCYTQYQAHGRGEHDTRAGGFSESQIAELLSIWSDTVIRTSVDTAHARALEQAFIEAHQREPHNLFLLFRFVKLLHHQGKYDQALSHLNAIRALDTQPESSGLSEHQRVDLHLWFAQILLSSGMLDEAAEHARTGLDLATNAGLDENFYVQSHEDRIRTLHLCVLTHAAPAIRGDREAIEHLRALVPRLQQHRVPRLLVARCHAYQAFGYTRNDALDEAADAYLRALEEVEISGLAAELPTYLLNVGTAYHRQGRLGLAWEYYARGSRTAQHTTRPSTRALLFANTANINIILGRHEEALVLLERAMVIVSEHTLHSIDIMCKALHGDVLVGQGHASEARKVYQHTLTENSDTLNIHQRAGLYLSFAEACLLLEDYSNAHNALNEARKLMERAQSSNLEPYHAMLRARLQWGSEGNVGMMAGIERFRRALLQAEKAGNHKLVLQQSLYLWRQVQAQGHTELMHEVSELVHRARNAIAMGLTQTIREDFLRHLPEIPSPDAIRSAPKALMASLKPATQMRAFTTASAYSRNDSAEIVTRFYRMLSFNELILQTEELTALWPRALDIALSLSGAERGYLLLRHEGSTNANSTYDIVASRDIDGHCIEEPHLRVSLTIAEEAAQTGQTVVTVNAREDSRFHEALSVVNLDLSSVLCVPVRNAHGLLGALYLDHRFQPGIFDGEVARMMEAYGHQLALAITNVRRLEALKLERTNLARTQEKLNELLQQRESALENLEARCTRLSEEVEVARLQAPSVHGNFPNIAYTSSAMERVLQMVKRAAPSEIPVVITGESGVGKELIARAVHNLSLRSSKPFVAVNCAAISESLFEAELFGYKKGSFTGANTERAGLFHAADGGTLFLDELGEMPLAMQVKLLRVLQDGHVRRIGATATEPVDVRIIAATNRDLDAMVHDGQFREDLFYRLAALIIKIPSLRERREDIPFIAHQLLFSIAKEAGKPELRLSLQGANILTMHDWPGNVRELENTLRTAAVLSEHDELGESELAPCLHFRNSESISTIHDNTQTPQSRSAPQKERRGRKPKASKSEVQRALNEAQGDPSAAANILSVSERTLFRYLQKYGISRERQ